MYGIYKQAHRQYLENWLTMKWQETQISVAFNIPLSKMPKELDIWHKHYMSNS